MELTELTELRHTEKIFKNLINNLIKKEQTEFNKEAKSKMKIAYSEIISLIIQYEQGEKVWKHQKNMFEGK